MSFKKQNSTLVISEKSVSNDEGSVVTDIIALENEGEQKEQSIIIKLSGLMFIVGFILSGLDYRYNWFPLPKIVTYIAIIIFYDTNCLFNWLNRTNLIINIHS